MLNLKLEFFNFLYITLSFDSRQLLEKELETVGIRLNKEKPNIYFKVGSELKFYIKASIFSISLG